MQKLALASALVSLALSGCGGSGGGPCAAEFDGIWIGTTIADQLDLSADCQFDYHGQGGCASTGTYAAPLGSQGSVEVDITSSTGGLCLPAGKYTCNYSASSSTLTFDCGAGAFSYGR